MSNIVSTLPEFPEYSNYLLTQDSKGNYLLLCFENCDSLTIKSDGNVKNAGGYHYKLSSDGESWDFVTTCGGNHPFTSSGKKPVFSTVDCYDSSGSLLYSGSSYIPPASFLGSMSSSDILFNTLSDIRLLVPLVFIATFSVIGFRKAWDFFRGLIRGA